jgi:O-glycosyl hydrolase
MGAVRFSPAGRLLARTSGRVGLLVRFAFLPSLGIAAACQPAAVAGTVVIDAGTRYQTIQGFGSSERVFDDPHLFNNFDSSSGRALTTMTPAQEDAVLDLLYRDLRLTRVRAVSPDTAPGAGIEPVNDNSDPNATDLSKFDFSWKKLDAHCDYFARARERGATTFFLSPLARESWMGVSTPTDAAEYAEWLLAQVERCAARGVRLPYVSVANEPSHTGNRMSGSFIRDVIANLAPRLRAAGFDTMFVAPDDVRSSNAAAAAAPVLADPATKRYVGAVATHLYDEPPSRLAELQSLATGHGLPLWMTEFTQGAMSTAGLPSDPFTWASLMHDLLSTYGVSAVDYLWGFFGAWEGDTTALVSLTNSGASYTGSRLNKAYFTTGQFSRFVAPGARRVSVEPAASPAEVSAYLDAKTLTIVAVNASQTDQQVALVLREVPSIERIDVIRTSETENWAKLRSLAPSTGLDVDLPARSVTTLVASFPSDATGNAIDGPVAKDTTRPRISRFSLSPERFAVARNPTALAATRRAKRGSTFRFVLSEPAAATIRLERTLTGRRSGRRCVKPRPSLRQARRCNRRVAIASLRRRSLRGGRVRIPFSGRAGRRALAAGRYRARIVARDGANNTSTPRHASFTIVRQPR